MSTRRRFTPALLLLTGFTISACTAILVPDQKDDGVERCDNTPDCTEIDDNRYVAQCVKPDTLDDNASSVCSADFAKIPCGGMAYGGDHVLDEAYADARDAQAAYVSCTMENRGKRGCPPAEGGVCEDGLSVADATGICDDPDAPIPAMHPPDVGGIEVAGQDAMDQFCRWYFCDETFVCDTTGSQPTCQPCSGTDPEEFGKGGCGQLYIQGEPSSFYTDLDNANCSGNKPNAEAEFGPAPTF